MHNQAPIPCIDDEQAVHRCRLRAAPATAAAAAARTDDAE